MNKQASELALHESWRKAYRENRYLRHLSLEQLAARFGEAFNNSLALKRDAKTIPVGFDGLSSKPAQVGMEAMERWTHVLEECNLRNLSIEDIAKRCDLKTYVPDLSSPIAQAAAGAMAQVPGIEKGVLFKYGKKEYLGSTFSSGDLRIQAASSFLDDRHNAAVRVSETTRSFKLAVDAEELGRLLAEHGLDKFNNNLGIFEFSVEYFTDYWVTCFCTTLSPRLAVDFNASALLVVLDHVEFRRRLRNAVRKVTDYSAMGSVPIDYFDPYMAIKRFRNIPAIKSIKYFYQQEYRHYWLPKETAAELQHLDVTMGPLADICLYVEW